MNDTTATNRNRSAQDAREPSTNRDVREIIRDEHFMRARILDALAEGPLTIPEIATAIAQPTHEVVFWVMGMRKYGYLAEIKEATDEGYFQYQTVPREQ